MDIQQELTIIKRQIDAGIDEVCEEMISQTKKQDEKMAKVLTYLRTMILAGGKRARPALVLYGYRAAGGKDPEKIMPAAIGIELIHASLLIHDDIMDRDDKRHGVSAMHAYYAQHANEAFGLDLDDAQATHFGISTGIDVGIYCYALGIELISEMEMEPQLIVKTISRIQKTIRQTGLGQFQDIIMSHLDNVSEKEVLSMYQNKTARYSFENPLQVGAILAGRDNAFCAQLSSYALPLGIAFQMQDDILGIYGDSQKTGKSVGSDIAEGKQTYLVVKARAAANDVQKQKLDGLLGKQDITQAQVNDFRTILDEIGVSEQVQEEMNNHLNASTQALESIIMDAQAKEFLSALVMYQKSRNH